MDIINYQYADPEQILKLTNDEFTILLNNKIYAINPNFVNSEECTERLINHLLLLPIGKDSLKLIKDLIIFFQSSILYCLKPFYSKHKKYFENLTSSQNTQSSTNATKKEIKFLQEIGSIYLKLIHGQEEIEELKFFTQYGLSNKDVALTKKDEDYQNKFLRWLKKSLVGLELLKNELHGEKIIQKWLESTENEFEELVKGKESVGLERLSLENIVEEMEKIPNFHKNIVKKETNDELSEVDKEENERNGSINKHLDCKRNSSEEEIKDVSPLNQELEALSSILPYFRRFFYVNEKLSHAEDVNLEYKNFKAPYDNYCVKHLRRAICGFLNRGGGVILVGVKEDIDDKSRIIKGQKLSEYKKEEVLIEYKRICEKISPDIISQGKYRISFVPIKENNGKYIQGKYIVRVEVAKGDNKCFYTIREDDEDFVVLRTNNQSLRRSITYKTLMNFKMRLLDPPKHPPLPSCPEPEVGIPLLEDKYETRYNEKHEYYSDEEENEEYYRNPYYQNSKKWKIKKTEPVSPPTKESKDFVYLNPKTTEVKDINETNKSAYKKKSFICDEEENEENKNEEEIKSSQERNFLKSKKSKINTEKSEVKEEQKDENISRQNQENEDDDLDFKPINPIIPRRENKQSKEFFQPFEKKKESNYIQKPDSKVFESYKVDRSSLVSYTDKPSCIDILVIGFPYATVNKGVTSVNLPLTEPLISCNSDLVTWLSVNSTSNETRDKINEFMSLMNKESMKLPETKDNKTPKIRKLFSNVYFQEEILLNKFINKFNHDEEFEDENGIYYYACKDKQQAIQAYMIGYDLGIKIKFISSEELKKKKLEHLKFKVEKRENERNNRNQEK